MDLATARDAVYLRTGYVSSDGQLTPQRLNQLLVSALRFLSLEHDWDWLQYSETLTTTAGTPYVTPLAGAGSTITWTRTTNVTGPTNYDIEQVPWQDYRTRPSTSRGSAPAVFAVRLSLIYLWPVPDSAFSLTHDFIRGEAALTSDQDSPLLPDQFCDAWVEKATELAYRRVNDTQKAEEAAQKYRDWMRVLTDNRRRWTGPRRITIRPGNYL